MKKWLFVVLVTLILVDIFKQCDAAGGKGKPRRKKKTTPMPLVGGKPAREPCIGMCYYRKLHGIVQTEKEKMKLRNWKPCVGLCYLSKIMQSKGEQGIVFVNKGLYGMY